MLIRFLMSEQQAVVRGADSVRQDTIFGARLAEGLRRAILPLGALTVVSIIGAVPVLGQAVDSVELGPRQSVWGSEFLRVVGVRRLSDGRLLVGDRLQERLLLLEAPGAAAETVGRRGRGPGEYGGIGQMTALIADTTLLEDFQYRHRHIVVGAGMTGEARLVPQLAVDAKFAGGVSTSSFAEIHPLVSHFQRGSASVPRLRQYSDSLVLVRFESGTLVDTIARLGGGFLGAKDVRKTLRGQTLTYERLSPVAAPEQAWLFTDGWMAVLRKEPYRVDWVRPDGRYVQSPPIPAERVRLDSRQRRTAIRASHRGVYRDVFTEDDFPPWPDWLPPFVEDALVPLTDGRVLVRRAPDARVDGNVYDLVDRRGRLVLRLRIAGNQRVVGSDESGIFVVTETEDGFEELTHHALPAR